MGIFGRRRRRCAFEQGVSDAHRKQRDDLLRAQGHLVGDDTEPTELLPDERIAYAAGRRSVEGERAAVRSGA
jgi:hypothetical protein